MNGGGQLLFVFTELQRQVTGILPSQYSELGDLVGTDGSLIDALLSMRGMTRPKIRVELERFHLGKFSHKDGHILQYTEVTNIQPNILNKRKISLPQKIKSIKTAPDIVGTTPF